MKSVSLSKILEYWEFGTARSKIFGLRIVDLVYQMLKRVRVGNLEYCSLQKGLGIGDLDWWLGRGAQIVNPYRNPAFGDRGRCSVVRMFLAIRHILPC